MKSEKVMQLSGFLILVTEVFSRCLYLSGRDLANLILLTNRDAINRDPIKWRPLRQCERIFFPDFPFSRKTKRFFFHIRI